MSIPSLAPLVHREMKFLGRDEKINGLQWSQDGHQLLERAQPQPVRIRHDARQQHRMCPPGRLHPLAPLPDSSRAIRYHR